MYKVWREEDIKKVIDEISTLCRYPCNIPIEISSRATKRMGAFFYKRVRGGIEPIKFSFAKILLDGRFSEEVVREVIIHEYIHYYCDTKMGVSNGHNNIFKAMCRICKISDETKFKYESEKNDEKEIKSNSKEYRIFCSKCNKLVCIHKRRDAVDKKIKNYISRCCKAKLILE